MDSRTRGGNGGLSRGGKTGNGTGSDRGVTKSGLTHVIYNGIFSDCGIIIQFLVHATSILIYVFSIALPYLVEYV